MLDDFVIFFDSNTRNIDHTLLFAEQWCISSIGNDSVSTAAGWTKKKKFLFEETSKLSFLYWMVHHRSQLYNLLFFALTSSLIMRHTFSVKFTDMFSLRCTIFSITFSIVWASLKVGRRKSKETKIEVSSVREHTQTHTLAYSRTSQEHSPTS